MDAAAIRRAVIESLLENASDGVFASLFWFAVGGLTGGPAAAALVVGHRLANTLDAMWAIARRHGVLTRARAGRSAELAAGPCERGEPRPGGRPPRGATRWRAQAGACDSPNAGPVMSAGAGALGLCLGGAARYHGQQRARPELGSARHRPTVTFAVRWP